MTGEKPLYYIATAQAKDEEMATRIHHHRTQRDKCWQTIEEPLAIADCLNSIAQQTDKCSICILIDCLTLWLCNLLCSEISDDKLSSVLDQLEQTLKDISGRGHDILLVSNETGLGIIPQGELSRRFVDESGRMHQCIAAVADTVTLMVAGLPMPLKTGSGLAQ